VAKSKTTRSAAPVAAPKASEVPALPAGAEEVVFAPMDGEGVVIKFIKRVGDPVSVDDLIAEIESDKANIEVTSPIDGVMSEFHIAEGTEVNVSPETKIATVKAVGEPAKPKIKPPTADFGSVFVNAPMDADTATITYKLKVGDVCELDDLIAEVESDKATIEVTAPCDGVITELFLKEGEEMKLTQDMQICSLTRTAALGSSIVTPFATSLGTPGSSMFIPGSSGTQTRVLTRHELAMVENMTVRAGDTRVFHLEEKVDFAALVAKSKAASVTPVVTMIKALADGLISVDGNKKLSPDSKSMKTYGQVDIGVAVDLEGQLKVAVIRDCASKTITELSEEVKMFSKKGAKLSAADQNLDKVCWVLSSMGKNATHTVIPVLPKGTAGIIGVGRTDENGKGALTATICHSTMTGLEGAKIFRAFAEKCV
jgi:pyruvate/2-oxoglutarate dehydrogenase complex dihydrolipoamide acyltransferase (E2) component